MFRTLLCQQPEIQVYQLLLFLFPVSNIIVIYFESIPLSNFIFLVSPVKPFYLVPYLRNTISNDKCQLLFIYLYLLLLPF